MLVIQEFKEALKESEYRNQGGQGSFCFVVLCSAWFTPDLQAVEFFTSQLPDSVYLVVTLHCLPSHLLFQKWKPWVWKGLPKGNVRAKTSPAPSSIAGGPQKVQPSSRNKTAFHAWLIVATFLPCNHVTWILFPQRKYVLSAFSPWALFVISQREEHPFLTFLAKKTLNSLILDLWFIR